MTSLFACCTGSRLGGARAHKQNSNTHARTHARRAYTLPRAPPARHARTKQHEDVRVRRCGVLLTPFPALYIHYSVYICSIFTVYIVYVRIRTTAHALAVCVCLSAPGHAQWRSRRRAAGSAWFSRLLPRWGESEGRGNGGEREFGEMVPARGRSPPHARTQTSRSGWPQVARVRLSEPLMGGFLLISAPGGRHREPVCAPACCQLSC